MFKIKSTTHFLESIKTCTTYIKNHDMFKIEYFNLMSIHLQNKIISNICSKKNRKPF